MVTKHHKVVRGGGECFFKIDGGLRQTSPSGVALSGCRYTHQGSPIFISLHVSESLHRLFRSLGCSLSFPTLGKARELIPAHPPSPGSERPLASLTLRQPCTAVVQLKHPRSSSMTSCGSVPASFPPPAKPSANVLVCTSFSLVSQALCQVPGEENVLNK